MLFLHGSQSHLSKAVVDVLINLGHLTVRLHTTEGLSFHPLISFPPTGSWVKASITQNCSTAGISAWYWWRDGIVQGQMGYTTTAGLVVPCLACPCCCDESSLWSVQIQTLSTGVLPIWSQGCTQYDLVFTVCTHERSVWGAGKAQQTFSECIHIYWECQPTTLALARVKN